MSPPAARPCVHSRHNAPPSVCTLSLQAPKPGPAVHPGLVGLMTLDWPPCWPRHHKAPWGHKCPPPPLTPCPTSRSSQLYLGVRNLFEGGVWVTGSGVCVPVVCVCARAVCVCVCVQETLLALPFCASLWRRHEDSIGAPFSTQPESPWFFSCHVLVCSIPVHVGACRVPTGTFRDYWRNPAYNLARVAVLAVLSFVFGVIFFKIGTSGGWARRTHAPQNLAVFWRVCVCLGSVACTACAPKGAVSRMPTTQSVIQSTCQSWAHTISSVSTSPSPFLHLVPMTDRSIE